MLLRAGLNTITGLPKVTYLRQVMRVERETSSSHRSLTSLLVRAYWKKFASRPACRAHLNGEIPGLPAQSWVRLGFPHIVLRSAGNQAGTFPVQANKPSSDLRIRHPFLPTSTHTWPVRAHSRFTHTQTPPCRRRQGRHRHGPSPSRSRQSGRGAPPGSDSTPQCRGCPCGGKRPRRSSPR